MVAQRYIVAQFIIADAYSQYYPEIVTSNWKEQAWSGGLNEVTVECQANKTYVLKIVFNLFLNHVLWIFITLSLGVDRYKT